MSRLNSLAPVIRLVAQGTPARASTERLWCVAQGSRTAVAPTLFHSLLGYRHFIVANRHDPAAVKSGSLDLPLTPTAEGDLRITGTLRYEARAVEGEEKRLVEMLATVPDPEAELHRQMQFWVAERMRRAQQADLEAFKQDILDDVQRRANEELGLDLTLTLTLSAQLKRSVDLSFTVHAAPRDTPRERLPVRLEGTLAPEPRFGWIALLAQRRVEEIEEAVREEIVRALAKRTYHELVVAEGEVLPRGLLDAVSAVAHDFGHVVRDLRLTPDGGAPIERSLSIKHAFEYTHRDARSAVTVRSDMLLDLDDAGRWVSAGRPRLDEWARREVQQATMEVLFAIPYRAFLLGFETQRQAIRERMQREAERVGYRIRVFHTVSGLQVDVLKESFTVRAGDDFNTSVTKVRAALDITVDARIPTPNERVERLLAQDASVPEDMRRRINFVADAALRSATPEDVYLYLDAVPEAGKEDAQNAFGPRRGETLRARLERLVTEELSKSFDAVVLQVSFAARANPISDCLDRLCGTEHRFDVKIDIKGGTDVLPFSGTLIVDAVDPEGWAVFVRLLPTIDDLKKTIGNFLRSRFADGDAAELRGTRNHALEALVEKAVAARIREAYGLVVRVRDWSRGHTGDEAAKLEQIGAIIEGKTADGRSQLEHRLNEARELRERQSADRKALLDERKRLQDELTRFYNERTDAQRASVRARIEEIDRQIREGYDSGAGGLDAMLTEHGATSMVRRGDAGRGTGEGLSLQQLLEK